MAGSTSAVAAGVPVWDGPPFESDALIRDPYPHYARLRALGRVVYDPERDTWMVGRYHDVEDVLGDAERYSHRISGLEPTLTGRDPPEHTRVREHFKGPFAASLVKSLEPRLRALADRLLAPLAAAGGGEVVGDVAHHLPIAVMAWGLGMDEATMAELMGAAPALDRERLRKLHKRRRGSLGARLGLRPRRASKPGLSAQLERGVEQLDAFFDAAGERSTGGFITDLLVEKERAGHVSREEMIDLALLMTIGGTETSTHLMATCAHRLATRPDEQERLRADPARVPGFVEEALRFEPPAQRRPRVPHRALTIGDVEIPAGARVEGFIAAANRDPQVFPDPDAFVLDRDPNPHLSFSVGPHLCLGAGMARSESVAFVQALLALPPLRLSDPDMVVRWPDNKVVRGPVRLPVRFG